MKESTLIQMAISILLLFLSSSSTFAYQLSLKNGFYWLTTRTSASLTALSSAASPYVPPLTDVKYRISEIVPKTEIESVRLRHIMVDSKEMADTCYQMIVSGEANFEDLVGKLSTCEHSRGKGGDLGWSFMENSTNVVEADQSAELFPRVVPLELLNAAYGMSKGNMQVVSSISATPGMDNSRRWHVVQLMDVMNKLSVTLLNRRREKFKLRQRKPLEIQLELDQTMTRSGADDETKDQLTYSIDTMGCQMNVADSERIEGQLSELGYRRVEESSKAKVVILNTCSIRDHAEQKVYSYLGPHAQRKRLGEDVALIVAGCVAQQEGEALVKRFPEVDVVMGPQYANRFGDLLDAVFDGNQVVATDPTYQTEDALPALRSRSDVTAFVNVIYGCNERCTYCVVPTTRGVEQSRTKEAIVAEVGELVKNGYKEVTLLGQNIDSWGRDMSPKQKFADMLAAVGNVDGVERVRFLTSHPKYMSTRVIAAVAANPKLMPCFNVPFQSGDNEVLQYMRRGYTRERYLQIVSAIRSALPDAAITADVIVGFPGETEEQFQRTLDLMEEVKFEQVNTAAYSPRPNTPASHWDNQLSEEVKQDRLQRINRLGSVHALERSMRFVGRVQPILVENISQKDPSHVVGRNPHSRLVYFKGSYQELKGKIVNVLITEAKAYSLLGKLV